MLSSNTESPTSAGRNRQITRSYLVECGWVIAAQVLSILPSFIGLKLLTGLLDPEAYGQVALALTAITLVQQLVYGPLSVALSRFYPLSMQKGESGDFHALILRSLASESIVVTIFAALIFPFFILKLPVSALAVSAIAVVFLPAVSGYGVLIQIENAGRRRVQYAVQQIVTSWGRMLAMVAGCVLFHSSAIGAVAGLAIFSGLSLVLLSARLRWQFPYCNNAHNKNVSAEVWKYQRPILFWGIATGIHLASDRWFLGAESGAEQVGIYAVLCQVGYYPIVLVTDTVNRFLQPILFEASGSSNSPDMRRRVLRIVDLSTILALVVTLFAFLVVLFFNEQILSIFVSPKYLGVAHLLPYVVLASGFFAAGQFASNAEMIRESPKALLPIKVGTAIVGVILNGVLVHYYGINGLVASLIAFSCLYLVILMILRRIKH
jgi:O-antigen/teichoic acid export membrane protein